MQKQDYFNSQIPMDYYFMCCKLENLGFSHHIDQSEQYFQM